MIVIVKVIIITIATTTTIIIIYYNNIIINNNNNPNNCKDFTWKAAAVLVSSKLAAFLPRRTQFSVEHVEMASRVLVLKWPRDSLSFSYFCSFRLRSWLFIFSKLLEIPSDSVNCFNHLLIYLLTYLFIYLLIYLLTYLFIYLFIHLRIWQSFDNVLFNDALQISILGMLK